MSDLADFLLARIAEDEERARVANLVEGADLMLAALPTDLFDALRVAFPVRVLAECEAKRRIVEAWQHESRGWDSLPARTPVAGALMWVMKELALPYAAHPDYREEWRP